MEKNHYVKHNLSKTRLYNIWKLMKQRCYNPKYTQFKDYGGREINVCKEWQKDFLSFYNWAINNGYDEKLTLDRIDGHKNYSPENCRWATKIMQQNNTRKNNYIEYKGEKYSISQWARILGVSRGCLQKRINKGWNFEKIISTPLDINKSHKKIKSYNEIF